MTIHPATAIQAASASHSSADAIEGRIGRPAARPYASVAAAYMPRGNTMLHSVCSYTGAARLR